MKRTFVINCLLLIASLSFCQNSNKSNLIVFDMARQFEKQQETPLSKFVNSVSYVPLETNPETIFGGLIDYEVNERYIIVRHHRVGPSRILLFNRNNGKFIREIGKYGKGPGEYTYHCYIPFNKKINAIYAADNSRNLLVYDSLGKYINRINVYNVLERGGVTASERSITFERTLDDTIYVGLFVNGFGTERNKVALLTKSRLLKVFPNYQSLNSKTIGPGFSSQRRFMEPYINWDNKLYFYQPYCDTLYQITKDLLIPRYYFDWGKYNVSRSEAVGLSIKDLQQKFFIYDIFENSKYTFAYVLFNAKIYLCYIDKKTNILTFVKNKYENDIAIENDVDGFMNLEVNNITQSNEMVFVIEAREILKWLNENPEKAIKARSRFPWLKSIDEFSNPVLAIAKCKQ
jgi:hypothetical protein